MTFLYFQPGLLPLQLFSRGLSLDGVSIRDFLNSTESRKKLEIYNVPEMFTENSFFLYLVDLKKTFSWCWVPWCRLFKTVLIQGKLPFFYFTCGRGFCAFLIHPWSCKKNANQKFFNTLCHILINIQTWSSFHRCHRIGEHCC